MAGGRDDGESGGSITILQKTPDTSGFKCECGFSWIWFDVGLLVGRGNGLHTFLSPTFFYFSFYYLF
jgi:hypothetical protein